MHQIKKSLLFAGALVVATRVTFAETVTLQAELVTDTMCDSGTPDTNYAATNFNLTGTSLYSIFYYGRDYTNATRFAALQWKLPLCPPGMRESAARVRIYASVDNNRGVIGFARLMDNPDLSALTWNSAVADGYIEGTDVLYRIALGEKAVSLSGTLSGKTPPSWYSCEIPATVLAQWLGSSVSSTQSNLLTILTLPRSGDNGTNWRGGCMEAGYSAELEVDFIPIVQPDVSVTNNLLVALVPDGVVTNGNGCVTAWRDNAPLGGWQDFVQTSTSHCPRVEQTRLSEWRTRPMLDFNPDNTQYLELSSSSVMDTNTWSWFVVFRPETISDTRILLRSAYTNGASLNSGSLWGTFQSSGGSDVVVSTRSLAGAISFTSHRPSAVNQWFVSGGIWNGTGAALNGLAAKTVTAQLRDAKNKAMVFSRAASTNAASACPSGHQQTRIGVNSSDYSTPFDGQIAEILIYNTVLSEEDQNLVMDYFYEKYFKSFGLLIKVF